MVSQRARNDQESQRGAREPEPERSQIAMDEHESKKEARKQLRSQRAREELESPARLRNPLRSQRAMEEPHSQI